MSPETLTVDTDIREEGRGGEEGATVRPCADPWDHATMIDNLTLEHLFFFFFATEPRCQQGFAAPAQDCRG